ncbi:MAG: hypothetical protein PHV13_02970 [Candidatus ainarchaeum sp.]|nr:hypothetical protein [Candidatus ainarchaeum sp.]
MESTTKKQQLLELYSQGKNPKEAARLAHAGRKHSENVYKEFLAKTGNSSAGTAKAQEKSKPGNAQSPAPASTSELPTKPEDVPIDDMLKVEQMPPPPAAPAAQPAQEGQASPPQVQEFPETISEIGDAASDVISAQDLQELRDMVAELYLYLHDLPATALEKPLSDVERKQFGRLGRRIALKYVKDMTYADLIFWGDILVIEGMFVASRFPAAKKAWDKVQADMSKKSPAAAAAIGVAPVPPSG